MKKRSSLKSLKKKGKIVKRRGRLFVISDDPRNKACQGGKKR